MLVSHFVDGSGNKAFMLSNLTLPTSSLTATVNLSLALKYKAVKIYSENGVSIVPISEGGINISIPSSSAIFVVPLEQK